MTIRYKQPLESRLYDFIYTKNLGTGETITGYLSVTTDPSGLTIGTPSFSGGRLQVRISGGVAGTVYTLVARVTTSAGNTLECEGKLKVQDM